MRAIFFILACFCVFLFVFQVNAFEETGRFQIVYSQKVKEDAHKEIYILQDTETDAKYLFMRDGAAGGMCKLEE